MSNPQPFVAIYTSDGEAAAFLVYPYIYNRNGDYIGWITRNKQVYSIEGHYVGWLSDERRILRKQSTARIKPRLTPPPPPITPGYSFSAPSIGKMPELKPCVFDVLLDAPELLSPVQSNDLFRSVG